MNSESIGTPPSNQSLQVKMVIPIVERYSRLNSMYVLTDAKLYFCLCCQRQMSLVNPVMWISWIRAADVASSLLYFYCQLDKTRRTTFLERHNDPHPNSVYLFLWGFRNFNLCPKESMTLKIDFLTCWNLKFANSELIEKLKIIQL